VLLDTIAPDEALADSADVAIAMREMGQRPLAVCEPPVAKANRGHSTPGAHDDFALPLG
jgi:hypothetical protein